MAINLKSYTFNPGKDPCFRADVKVLRLLTKALNPTPRASQGQEEAEPDQHANKGQGGSGCGDQV